MNGINDIIKRKHDEDYADYFVRLFENKKTYGLTSEDIAGLLNFENGNNFGESSYRKDYASFNRGRIYERTRGESGIYNRIRPHFSR